MDRDGKVGVHVGGSMGVGVSRLEVLEGPSGRRRRSRLKARLAEVEAALAEVREANRRLEDILRTSQRAQFGKRSEKLSPDQFNLALADAELAQGVLEAAQEKAEAALRGAGAGAPCKPRRNRGHPPPHLPQIERVIEPASTQCPAAEAR